MSWVAVVPVKGNPGSKTRLGGLGGLGGRAGLADAFALDTVSALLGARGVDRVFVVTADARLAARLAALGAEIVREDRPAGSPLPRPDALNAAIRQGLSGARAVCPHANLAVVTGDLPALTPADVERTLALAAAHDRSMVADADATGTTSLLALAGVWMEPRFGLGSRAAHEAAGHVPLPVPASAGIRRDVDTTADLVVAQALGLGLHTGPLAAAALAAPRTASPRTASPRR